LPNNYENNNYVNINNRYQVDDGNDDKQEQDDADDDDEDINNNNNINSNGQSKTSSNNRDANPAKSQQPIDDHNEKADCYDIHDVDIYAKDSCPRKRIFQPHC